VVGHSYGGVIALQLAHDRPELVGSLALLEPALQMVPSGPGHVARNIVPAVERYRSGDVAGALDTFLGAVFGPGWRVVVEEAVPGAVEATAVDAAMFFGVEVAAIRAWTFGPEEAASITQPVLSVLGVQSAPTFHDGRRQLHAWLRQVEDVDVEETNHLLQMANPDGVAVGLRAFFGRHPIDPD